MLSMDHHNKTFHKIKQSVVVQVLGKDVTTYESKLDYAHPIGMRSLDVDILQYSTELIGNRVRTSAP